MKSQNRYEGIDPYTVQQVRYHARQMLRHRAMSGMEIEDIEQELMLDYLSRIQSFDPEKSCRKTFVDRIVRHKCASMIAKATAEKRNRGIDGISLDSFTPSTGRRSGSNAARLGNYGSDYIMKTMDDQTTWVVGFAYKREAAGNSELRHSCLG